ncbi:TonB-dependent receptor plug domain-containing protein [Pelosinus propionicus]|uniref:Vitamin B12 transporter n=1 Tax=Pelosinus propionicus DSM 13327 TaxID=1123291 RepID=A0A1I4IXN8_9FIRM|nr:TonB-dependent receptor [Pelosinus propionicus]SFL59142.1 vitamin B12 transporter [Pelosinus propionicus DSM 13327]
MSKQKQKLLCALICSAISLTGMTDIAAAEEEQSFEFDEYVVTANRIPVKKSEVAANVTVIENEMIEKKAYTKVSDILKDNNVSIGTSNFASYPIINGDDRVMVLVNGRKMNWGHLIVSGNSRAVNIDNLAVKNIERIEIVRGPNSALYGSSAMGGVINIITKKAKEDRTVVSTEFGTWNSERYSLVTEGVDNDISYVLTMEKQKRGNFDYKSPRSGKILEFNSSEIDRDYESLYLEKQLGDDSSLALEVERMEENNGYGLNLKTPATEIVTYPNSRRSTSDLNVALTYSWNKTKGAQDYFRIYQNNDEATAHYGSPYWHDLKATGAEWQQSWTINDRYTLVGGAETRKEHFDEISSNTTTSGDVTSTSLFAENRWKMGDQWSLTLGSRLDHQSIFGNDVTSHISVNKELSNNTNVYLSWGQGVKNPTLKMLYADNSSMKGNKDLKQEQSDTVTLGINRQVDQNTTLQASVYSTRLNNAIKWVPGDSGAPGIYENVNREKRQGLEISAAKILSDQWNVKVGYSYSKGKILDKAKSTNYQLDPLNARPNGYFVGADYHQEKWDVGLTLQTATGRSTKAYTDNSYLALDLTAGYQADQNTRFYLKGYNLTNEAYELISQTTTPGKFPMPSRSFTFGVERRI